MMIGTSNATWVFESEQEEQALRAGNTVDISNMTGFQFRNWNTVTIAELYLLYKRALS